MQRFFQGILLSVMFAAFSAAGQTNVPAATNSARTLVKSGETLAAAAQQAEQERAECIKGRRMICGKILLVRPDGLVVESGYTNLMREPLTRSWLVPGTVTAYRAANLVESHEPGAICIGTVFLTDLPRARGRKPKQYDYVILEGYPAGQHTYHSIGAIHKTVRRFSAKLTKAVEINLQSGTNTPTAATEAK